MSSKLPKRPGRASYRSRGERIYPGSLKDLVGPVIVVRGVGSALWWCPGRTWRTDTMTLAPGWCFSLAASIRAPKTRCTRKEKCTRKGQLIFIYQQGGSSRVPWLFADRTWIHIVHGADPDTIFRSRDGPGHELLCGSHPASSVHGPDPDTGFCAGRSRTQAS